MDRLKTILGLALPIVGAMLSQNVLNVVDTAMVGSLGDSALAAVGAGSFANFMATSFIMGLSPGVQAMVARRRGEGMQGDLAVPLNGALFIAASVAVPASLALYLSVPSLFPILNENREVYGPGIDYLQFRLLAMTAVGMNFSFRGYWNATLNSQLYLRTLLIMHVTNIGLNWVLIFGQLGAPALGVAGAGLASAISTYVGTTTYFVLAWRHARPAGFLRGLPDRSAFRTMLRLAVPTGFQQLTYSAGFTVLFWIIGQVGTREAAAANVLINLMLVLILPGMAFGLAAASLVGQALGRKDVPDAHRWGWDVAKLACAFVGFLGLVLAASPDPVLSVFLHDPETIEVARAPLRILGVTVSIDAAGFVLQNALLGAGASGVVMRTSVATQWGLFLPTAYLVGPILGWGLFAIWVAQVGYRAILTSVYALLWQRGAWARIQV